MLSPPSRQAQATANVTLATDKRSIVAHAQSAVAGAQSAIKLAKAYVAGNRTLAFDPANKTSVAGFVDYTQARLAFEDQLRSGEKVEREIQRRLVKKKHDSL